MSSLLTLLDESVTVIQSVTQIFNTKSRDNWIEASWEKNPYSYIGVS